VPRRKLETRGASKRAKAVRASTDFDLARLTTALRPPKEALGVWAWTLEKIRAARDAQMRGDFREAVALGHAMRTDPAILTAQLNRLAPARGLPVRLSPPRDNARARRQLDEAEALFGARGIAIRRDTITSLNACLADHELAIGINDWTPRPDGSRVDIEHRYWPLEHVRWDPVEQVLKTRLADGSETVITHGDGTWVVYSSFAHEPWKHGAILPGALVWAARAYGVRDLSKGTSRHADAKVVGTLPQGVPMQDETGALTREATEMLELTKVIASADTPFGLKPFGAAVDYLVNTSQAWQVYSEVIKLGDRDAAKIYLGQDGSVSDSGGNYIKSKFLFGVRNDIVEGELKGAFEPAIKTGIIDPWAAVNFGDSESAPVREWQMPDADQDARLESLALRVDAFNKAITELRGNGFVVDQALVVTLAADFDVPPPALADTTPSGADFYAYEIEGGIVTIDEVRARKGLAPLPGGAGAMTVPMARARAESAATAPIPSLPVGTPQPATAPSAPGASGPAAAPPAQGGALRRLRPSP
jgi:hypothetical protein